MKGILVTNFAYGTGPYLRTTDLAIAFNDALEKRGRPRLRCLIPWVYGEKQRTVMREEFGGHAAEYQDEIILDPALGKLLGGIFYKKEKYHNSLARWIATCEETEDAMRRHLVGTIRGEMLDGKEVALDGKDIVVELNRSPRCNYGVAPSYSASFGYLSLILERAASHGEAIAVPEDLLRKGVTLARRIEAAQKIFAVAYPSTFTDTPDYRSPYSDKRREVIVPPLISVRSPKNRELLKGKGIFVTITGIPGLERLYRDARSLGLRLYSNDTNAVPDATYASPHALEDDAILLHFARSGWSSVWLSMIYDTALVVPG